MGALVCLNASENELGGELKLLKEPQHSNLVVFTPCAYEEETCAICRSIGRTTATTATSSNIFKAKE